MNFSHLIQVNDPTNLLIEALTREQLWNGLVLRAERPALFVLALDEVHILERNEHTLIRELRFGKAKIRDKVCFENLQQVRYDTDADGDIPAATLVMRIEEPQSGQLFVRFEYETPGGLGQGDEDEFYSGFVKNAYMKADLDTIFNIRRLVDEGQLRKGAVN